MHHEQPLLADDPDFCVLTLSQLLLNSHIFVCMCTRPQTHNNELCCCLAAPLRHKVHHNYLGVMSKLSKLLLHIIMFSVPVASQSEAPRVPKQWTTWDFKNMFGSEWRETNNFSIPFELCHEVNI